MHIFICCLSEKVEPSYLPTGKISRIRVRVEQAIGSTKFMRIFKDECRFRANQFVERIFALCAALHNLSIKIEPWTYKI